MSKAQQNFIGGLCATIGLIDLIAMLAIVLSLLAFEAGTHPMAFVMNDFVVDTSTYASVLTFLPASHITVAGVQDTAIRSLALAMAAPLALSAYLSVWMFIGFGHSTNEGPYVPA